MVSATSLSLPVCYCQLFWRALQNYCCWCSYNSLGLRGGDCRWLAGCSGLLLRNRQFSRWRGCQYICMSSLVFRVFAFYSFLGSLAVAVGGRFHTVVCSFELAFGMLVEVAYGNQWSDLHLARNFSYLIQIIVLPNYYNFYWNSSTWIWYHWVGSSP